MQDDSNEVDFIPVNREFTFDPARFIGVGWKIWRGPADGRGLDGEEEEDARSLALNSLDLDELLLESCLKKGERYTTGEECIKRLNRAGRIKLDARAFQALWENRNKLPRRFKQQTDNNMTFIHCDGTVLRSPDGHRCTLCFCYIYGPEWYRRCDHLQLSRYAYNLSASFAGE